MKVPIPPHSNPGVSEANPVAEDQIAGERVLLDDAEQIAAVKAGLASLDAGRSVPYEDVRRWLMSWGTEGELPPPTCP